MKTTAKFDDLKNQDSSKEQDNFKKKDDLNIKTTPKTKMRDKITLMKIMFEISKSHIQHMHYSTFVAFFSLHY